VSGGVVVVGGSDERGVYADAFLMAWDADEKEVTYRDLPDLPVPSAFGSAEAIGDTVYVLGGKQSKNDTDLSGGFWTLDLKDVNAGWTALPALPGEARFKCVTAAQRGPNRETCVYVFSGARTTTGEDGAPRFHAFADGYRFDPTRRSWKQVADLPVLPDSRLVVGKERFRGDRWPISAGVGIAFRSDEILTFGGSTDRYILDEHGNLVPPGDRPFFANRVLSYNTVSDEWSDAGTMPIGVVTTRAAWWNDLVVIPSGEVKPGIRTPKVQATSGYTFQPGTTAEASPLFGALDYTVLAIYLAVMVGVGVYFSRRESTTEEFFLAGRKIPWWAAGLSIFGTQLSAITFMAIPATSFGSDWTRFVGSMCLLPVLVMVIFCFLPFFRRLNITTAYEYLEARFSLPVRLSGSALFILFQLGRMGIVLLLPAIALSAVTGIDTYVCIGLMGLLATVYTTLGGISAVIWTDVLQVVVLIGGALLCLVVAVQDSGGVSAAIDVAQAADKFHMFDWRWSTTDMVGWVLIVGFLFTNMVSYTTDQTVIQRYLTTRDERSAARSLWLNLAITIPTGLLFFGLGTALFVYYAGHPLEQAQLPSKVDQLVPWFVVTHLPAGVAGVVVAGIFAAAMSSLDSSMNSITTAVVNDFVERFRPGKDGAARLRLAKRMTIALGVIGTTAAMILATYEIKYLFDFFQKVIGLFGGSLAGVFVLGVFTRRTNGVGAMVGLVAGGFATIAIAFLTETNFLLYAAIGNVVCVAVGYAISRVTGGTDRDLAGLTMWTRTGVES